MATVKAQVSEALLGTTEEQPLSAQSRAIFTKYARKDEETGEYYLDESAFISAIAPEKEDYVSGLECKCTKRAERWLMRVTCSTRSREINTQSCSTLQTEKGRARCG
jgi:hypothetical protein